MGSLRGPGAWDGPSGGSPAPSSPRHTSHTGKQSALGYGLAVAWHHLRPFIPFFLISSLVVALVYLMQIIVYGGPFTDPLFFVKFNERWPRPRPRVTASPEPFSPVPASLDPFLHFGNRSDV